MKEREAETQDQATLKGVIAILLSMAAVCERLSGLPRPLRGFLLWVLRSTEALVRRRVVSMAEDFGFWLEFPADPLFPEGDTSADTLRLGQRFEMLAEVLDDLLHYHLFTAPGSAPAAASPIKRRHRIRELVQSLNGMAHWVEPWPDTS